MQDEHEKALAKMKAKYENKFSELETQLQEESSKRTEVEVSSRTREENDFKKNTEYNKLNALIEQKLEMTEKELTDYKAKYQAKDADFKEVNKELNRKLKELQNMTNKAHLSEQLHQEEIQQLKQDYESKMKAMKEELDAAKQGSESTSNASPGQTQISQ